ncbi:MAG TPA: hypothetical protein DCY95_13205 [Algoriphagus sp.]|nr:hypothetical protein [Algoriphagus sp.]
MYKKEENNMPNHTINNVDIAVNTGEEKELLALAELKNKLNISENQFDFEGIIPSPKWEQIPNEDGELPTLDKSSSFEVWRWKDGSQDDRWYYWNKDHWDTKWNSYDVEVDANFDDELTVQFLTAWSAPIKIFEKVREYCEENNLALNWEVSYEDDNYETFYDLMKEVA